MANGHTVPNLSTVGCPEQVVPTLDWHLSGLSLLFFVRPPASSRANEPGSSRLSRVGAFEPCACFCKRVWESQQVFRVFGSNVDVRLGVSARGCGRVKAHGHWQVGAWEDGAAGGHVTVWVCVRCSAIVCQQACTRLSPPAFVPFTYTGLYARDYPGFRHVLQPFHL